MTAKVLPPVNEETESSILDIAPDEECLDWICYLVRGGRDPAEDAPASKPPAPSTAAGVRPARGDVERALGRLVTLGMLSCDGRRWSITAKGHAANAPAHRRGVSATPAPASARATSR